MFKRNTLLVLMGMAMLIQSSIFAQHDSTTLQIAFYNTENFFDTRNDSLTNDDMFTPEGLYRWTYTRFKRKVSNISKVFIAMGEVAPPDIIGLAEIENEFVLKQLCYNSPLANYKYKFVHYESPDSRGIDVALLYRPQYAQCIASEAIPIVFPFEPKSKNRDILYCRIVTIHQDTLHIFINHWTSRFSGYAATIPKRNYYAQVLRTHCDSILEVDPNANIIIMGDFNDYPYDESILKILKAKALKYCDKNDTLINLMAAFDNYQNIGTHKHEEFWGCLDQMIVNKSLIQGKNCRVQENEAHIFQESFMMLDDEKYGGKKVFRTYLGPKYIGGYADHLPIYIILLTSGKR